MYKKVLITGQMRSGTTLLCNFLNSQQHITMYADMFHSVAGKIPDPRGFSMQKIDYLLKLPVTMKYYILYSISYGIDVLKTANKLDYQLNVAPDAFTNMKELYDILLASIASEDDVVVGHKVTECEVNIANLVSQTDVKVIYIYRDARDVVMSAVKKFNYNVQAASKHWNQAIDSVLSVKNKNLLKVKFEDLVSCDEKLRQDLSAFLGTEITFDLQQLYAFNNQWVSNSSFGDVNSLFDKKVIARWRNKPATEINAVYSLCKDRLATLEYDMVTV